MQRRLAGIVRFFASSCSTAASRPRPRSSPCEDEDGGGIDAGEAAPREAPFRLEEASIASIHAALRAGRLTSTTLVHPGAHQWGPCTFVRRG